ncbi:MAG: copper-translocating P-type ATPase [Capsulimonas sp.]|uniref:copper-translocating P-type ATPase n=1 Tax=Capsulimonas sp. TaxID=2494211 RepID=UPI0032640094
MQQTHENHTATAKNNESVDEGNPHERHAHEHAEDQSDAPRPAMEDMAGMPDDGEKHQLKGHDHGGMSHDMNDSEMAKGMEADIRHKFWVALAFSVVIVLLSPMSKMLGITISIPAAARSWALLALTTPVVFWCGWMFISGAFFALRARKLDMSVLIAVGVLAAYLASVYLTLVGSSDLFYEAAAMLVTFVLFGHWMEMKSRRGTSDALQALFKLVPPKARVIRDGKEIEVATSEVVQGDLLALRPGDRIPVDGEITEGETSVDEALVTGESLPVEKNPGDKVVAGSINGAGSVKFKATGVGEETTLARIAKLVETAQNSKAPGQRLADKAAAYLVVLAVGAGVITFVAWRWGAGASFLTALTFSISAVVIACPDALGLATPTAVAVGTGLGAKHNILIKDAATLEGASRITAVALDKTGTLTEGKPRVVNVAVADGTTEDEALKILAAAERNSSHPLAVAILEEAKKRKLQFEEKVQNFENIAGHGLKAVVKGQHVLVGNARFLTDTKIDLTPIQSSLDKFMAAGQTVILLAVENKAVAVVGVSDPVKPSAKRAVAELKKLGIQTALISGDNKIVAEAVGKEVGVDRVFAEVLPENKADYIKQLQVEGKFVAMVGDGVNDAPALAQADIGIAIGAGTDVAIEAAKVVLMKSDPLDILNAILISKATVRKMKQNLVWASIYNLSAIPVAAGVFYHAWGWSLRPEVSALLMSASSIIVAVNAVMLRKSEKTLLT